MRSLAHDLGESLGCGGHVSDLVRLSSGAFHADEAITPDQLEEASNGTDGWEQYLHPVDWVLRDLKSISVGAQAEQYLRDESNAAKTAWAECNRSDKRCHSEYHPAQPPEPQRWKLG